MQQVTVDEAKMHLTDLIDAAVAGEEILITKDGGLMVELVPRLKYSKSRRFGSAMELISMAPDLIPSAISPLPRTISAAPTLHGCS